MINHQPIGLMIALEVARPFGIYNFWFEIVGGKKWAVASGHTREPKSVVPRPTTNEPPNKQTNKQTSPQENPGGKGETCGTIFEYLGKERKNADAARGKVVACNKIHGLSP